MSSVASKLAASAPTEERVRRGPTNVCGSVYEPDLEDSEAINEFRDRSTESWASTQRRFDELLGVTKHIPNDKFRYHWKRRCGCWPDELRQS